MYYDVVVIGAGPNGLTLATRLAEMGQSVGVFDRSAVAGGLCQTDRSLAAGFAHQPHATFLNAARLLPEPTRRWWFGSGLHRVAPQVQHAIAFRDGTPGIAIHRRDHVAATCRSIARHSAQDARAYARLHHLGSALAPALGRVLYAPPDPAGVRGYVAATRSACASHGVSEPVAALSAAELIDRLFVSDPVRTLLLRVGAELGADPDVPGGALGFLGMVMPILGGRSIPRGGMGALAAAMTAAARTAGVQVHLGAEVGRITLHDGRATGIVLADGTAVAAGLAVASSAGAAQTLAGLIGDEHLTPADVGRLRSDRPVPTLTSQHFCLAAPPRYRSARGEPDVDRAAQVFVGFDTPAEVLQHHRSVRAGELPRPGGAVCAHALLDPGQAPPGASAITVNTLFPSIATLPDDLWRGVIDAYPASLRETWSAYAPNVTAESVTAVRFGSPQHTDRTLVLAAGPSQYATGVPGAYLCGTNTFPGGGVHGACGWNAARVILDAALAT